MSQSLLSEAERHGLVEDLCGRTKATELWRIATQLQTIESELASLNTQLDKLQSPGGDRVLAKMVKTRLDESKRGGLGLLRKATNCMDDTLDAGALRLMIAERADSFEAPAREAARILRRQALDTLLKATA